MSPSHASGSHERLALSDLRFQAVFDQSPVGIYLLDTQLRITDMNASAEGIIGAAAENVGHLLSEIMHRLWTNDVAEAAMKPFHDVLSTAVPSFKTQAYETRRRGSSERLFFDWEVRRLTTQDGLCIGLVCSFIEVTAHIEAREIATTAQAKLQLLTESVPQLIWSTDASGRMSYVNQQWIDFTGMDLGTTQASDFRELVHPDDYDTVMEQWAAAFAGGRPYQIEFRYRRAGDGSYRWHLVRAWPRRDADGTIVEWNGTSTDIHDLKVLAANLARSNADLEQFASVASHDLKEPLRMVSSYLSLIEGRYAAKLDDPGRTYIRTAVDAAGRMSKLIDAIMEYSQAARPGVILPAISASAPLSEALALLAERITSSAAVVTHDPLPAVIADPLQLGRVFQNLIGNALKFCPGRTPAIHITARASGDLVTFAVRDNGIGFPESEKVHAFQMFRRHHAKENIPGTGIGLATCRKIVENHGGSIWLESEEGLGTVILFTLPKAKSVPLSP